MYKNVYYISIMQIDCLYKIIAIRWLYNNCESPTRVSYGVNIIVIAATEEKKSDAEDESPAEKEEEEEEGDKEEEADETEEVRKRMRNTRTESKETLLWDIITNQ